MRILHIAAPAVVALMLIAACGDPTPEGETTTSSGVTSTTLAAASDAAAVVAEVQSEVSELATEVQESAAAEVLNEAWSALSAEITEAAESVETDGFELPHLELQLQEFESTLDSLGDEIEPELRQAWTSLRRSVEPLTN